MRRCIETTIKISVPTPTMVSQVLPSVEAWRKNAPRPGKVSVAGPMVMISQAIKKYQPPAQERIEL